MQHLPLFTVLANRDCLVVGGGPVAERRVELLLRAGAAVTVIAPELSAKLEAFAAEGRVRAIREPFVDQPLDPYWIVIAAAGNADVNSRVATAAHALKRFCNVVDAPESCSAIMPAIVDREPVTIAISSGGHAPVLARRLKGLVETTVPLRIGRLAELAGRWRRRAAEALPDADRRRRFWQSVLNLEGRVAELSLSGRDEESERELQRSLERWRRADTGAPGAGPDTADSGRTGEAYLVGAGPGSADLITLRARELLADADVVLYDRLVGAAVLDYARRDAELVSVAKTAGRPSVTQEQINALIVRHVRAGRRVCRLKGGDPMIFGRGGEELEALAAAGLPFQVVPGVSAVEGCAAYAGIPLTLRGESQALLITTGHVRDGLAADLASFKPGQTLALYMAVANLRPVAAELMRHGHARETPVAIIEKGTTDAQRVVRARLGDLDREPAPFYVESPALLVVGQTARFAERYHWFAAGRLEVYERDATGSLARVS